jgi:ribosome-associated toxin RatA of RatAB toxin-antitoxin module
MQEAGRLSWVEVEIARDADHCWRLLCDVERTPSWVPGVAAVRILETDGAGRAVLASFVGMPSRASFAYTLRYHHDDERRTLRWESEDRDLRELSGEARLEPLGECRCLLYYGLCSSAAEVLPGWAQVALRDERPGPVAEAFRRFAES